MNPFSSSLVTIRRSPYQALVATVILSVTFFVAYSLSFFLAGSEVVLRFFETRPQVIAFFEIEAPVDQINEVSQAMSQKSYVGEIDLVTKEEALGIYQEENKEDPLLLELVTAQILPASIEVSGKEITDLDKIKSDLEQYEVIDDVVLPEAEVDTLMQWTSTIRYIGLVSVGVLGLVSFLIMTIIIGMKVLAKRQAIKIMRLIGATKWFIKAPFVYEGVIYGVVSSIIGWGLSVGGLFYLTPWLQDFLGSIKLFPIPLEFYIFQLSVGTLVGILLGSFAGALAVGRLIKK